ncbi:glycosyltransferase [Candidatus Uabimicrobium amorphum]|uniref:Glycosyl transferase n=1 Tax=Uabimicrobium amorphum TaxID=2596890 RepID=A0A5S9F4K5_UABAM|nr:glycosyltransferase [Candidatus Uabimicrobium amorphum]BBM85897.1 glycosyl transferase [Candidatus Uabimicrobium amorphum]
MEISVIIPTFNRSLFLPKCIQSVLLQNYPVKEIIIIDDFSDDNTTLVVENLIKENQTQTKIIYLKQTKNQGVSSARNLGLNAAQYNIVLFLDSDDYWEQDYTSNVVNIFEKYQDVSIIFTRLNVIDSSNRLSAEQLMVKEKKIRFWRQCCESKDELFFAPTQQVKRHVLMQQLTFFLSALAINKSRMDCPVFFDSNLYFAEDHEYLVRLLDNAKTVAYTDKPLSNYVIHGSNTVLANADYQKHMRNLHGGISSCLKMLACCDNADEYQFLLEYIINKFRLIGWLKQDQNDRHGAYEAFRNSYLFSRKWKDLLRVWKAKLYLVFFHKH